MKFMGRASNKVNLQPIEIVYEVPHCLYGIGVEDCSVLFAEPGHVFNVSKGADFVVGMHEGNEGAWAFGKQLLQLLRIHKPLSVDAKFAQADRAISLQLFECMQN